MAITLQMRDKGKFAGKTTLTLGDPKRNGNGTIEIGGRKYDPAAEEKARHKANWNKNVAQGRELMLRATKAIARNDEAAALRALGQNEFALAAYLTEEKAKQEHRFCKFAEGKEELHRMQELLRQKLQEARQS